MRGSREELKKIRAAAVKLGDSQKKERQQRERKGGGGRVRTGLAQEVAAPQVPQQILHTVPDFNQLGRREGFPLLCACLYIFSSV